MIIIITIDGMNTFPSPLETVTHGSLWPRDLLGPMKVRTWVQVGSLAFVVCSNVVFVKNILSRIMKYWEFKTQVLEFRTQFDILNLWGIYGGDVH